MANFCGKCGAPLDSATGLCPNCDKKEVKTVSTKTKSKVATTIVTILLAICFFLSLTISVLIYDVRNAVKEDNVTKILDNIEVADILKSLDNVEGMELEKFYEHLDDKYDIEMTDQKLKKFIEQSTLKKFVAEKISDFAEDFVEGDARLEISSQEVADMLDDNTNLIEGKFEFVENWLYSEIAYWIVGGDEAVIFDTNKLESSGEIVCNILRVSFSYITMTIFIAISLVIIFFMLRNSVSQGMVGLGTNLIILGAFTLGVSLLTMVIPSLGEVICGGSAIGMMAGSIIGINMWLGLLLLLMGIAAFIIRKIIVKKHTMGGN